MFVMPISRLATRNHSAGAFNGHSLDADRALDRLFNETLDRVFSAPATARLPALDLQETEHGYSAEVDVPGYSRDDVKVSIDGKRVSIETVARQPARPEAADAAGEADAAPAKAQRWLVRERSKAVLSRSFALPVEIDEAASRAKLENGVLTLTLAKRIKPVAQLSIN